MQFKSYKARRIVHSFLPGELIGFANMLEISHTTAAELRRLHPKHPIPVRLFTNRKSLLYDISKGSTTSERRLILDIAAALEELNNHEISDIGFIRSGANLVDGLTTAMHQAKLREAFCGILNVKPEKWIVRSNPNN